MLREIDPTEPAPGQFCEDCGELGHALCFDEDAPIPFLEEDE